MFTMETYYGNKSKSFFLECCYRPVGGSLYIYDGRSFKVYFVCLSYPIRIIMNTANTSTSLGGENSSANKQIKKFSLLINDSDSDDNILTWV